MDGIEGVGEAVTGAMIARSVEPERGEAGHRAVGNCLNCGAQLEGEYCHLCGQKAHVHRTLGAFWHDILHSVLHFEGKIWRTLPLLAWRPGELTRRYVEGERARFVSPVALFLFSVFLMFAIFSMVGGPFSLDSDSRPPAQARAETERDFRADQAESRQRLAQLRSEREQLVRRGEQTVSVDVDIANTEQEMRLRQRLFEQAMALIDAQARREAEQSRSDAASGTREIASGTTDGGGEARLTVNRTGVAWLDRGIEKAEKNPELLLYKLQTNAYKFSWALIPISVPFVWLLFLHRRRYWRFRAYDHTVFVTYSIAFMSLGLIALSLLRPLGLTDTFIGLAIAFVPPLHMYRQLRGAYSLSRWSALWRTFALIMFAFVAGALFFSLLMMVGAFG